MVEKISFEEQFMAGKPLDQVLKYQAAASKRLATELGEMDAAAAARQGIARVGDYLEEAQVFVDNWGKMQGISSGYAQIDNLTHGFVGGELIVLGGYTSRGKTQLATNIAWRTAKAGRGVLFVTLEMTKPMITSRLMRLGEIDHETPIYFQTADQLEPSDLDAVIGQAVKMGVEFVIVDHLHYFARGDNILGRVGEVTYEFSGLAKKYNLPVLLLSQLSRPDRSKHKGKLAIPVLSDLKESGYIEQDADIVLMVHRNFKADDETDLTIDPHEVFVAQRKNRSRGMIGSQVIVLTHEMSDGVTLSEPAKIANLEMFPGAQVVD